MICNKCGAEINDGAKFCGTCGSPVEDNVDIDKASDNSAKKDNFDDDSFDDHTEIIFDKKIQKDKIKKGSKLPIIISILGIVIVSAVAGVALVVNNNNLKKTGIETTKEGKIVYNKGNKIYAKDELIDENNDTYYFNESGEMAKNEWVVYKGKWYYAKRDGRIAKNEWVESLYYVDQYGEMLRNTTTPDGFKVGPDGKWVDPSIEASKQLEEQQALQAAQAALNKQNQSYKQQTQATYSYSGSNNTSTAVANIDYSQPVYIVSTKKYSDFIEYDDETQVDIVVSVPVFGGQNQDEVTYINDSLNTSLSTDLIDLIEGDIHSKTDDEKPPRKVNISESAVQNITDTRVNVILKGVIERKSGSSIKVNYRYIYERDNKTGYFRQ